MHGKNCAVRSRDAGVSRSDGSARTLAPFVPSREARSLSTKTTHQKHMKTNTSAKALSPAVAFFYEHAGWSYDPVKETSDEGKLRCAQALADAEAKAASAGVQFRWEQDDITNREHGAIHSKKVAEYYLWQCCAYHEGEVIGSLSAVDFGADGEPWGEPYARVVQAEIVSEWQATAQPR